MRRSDPVRFALALLRPRVPLLLLAVALGVAGLGSALALTGLSAWLITRAWQMPPVLALTVAVVSVRALGISRAVFTYCERLDTALRAAGSAREQLYTRLAGGPIERAMRWRSGDLVSRLGGDVDELSDVIVRAVLPACVAAVLGSTATAVIAVISPASAVVLAGCLLVAGVVAPWSAARAAAAEEDLAARHHADRDATAMLALEHAPELRVAGRLDTVLAETCARQRDWGDASDRAAVPAAWGAAAPVAAVGVSVLGAAGAGISLAGSVAPTTVAVLMLLPLAAFEATAALPRAAVQFTRSRLAARRLLGLTVERPVRTPRPQIPAVTLEPGLRLVVTGPSGAGKTTLLTTLAGDSRSRSAATFFAEDAHLFATTVRDNLLVARGDSDDDEVQRALDRVGLGGWLSGLPDGLDTVLAAGAHAVSAGQRRRLLLARALLVHTPAVLLDEPTEHLDAADADRLLREILEPDGLFGPDRAVVVATHHLPDDIECRRVHIDGPVHSHS